MVGAQGGSASPGIGGNGANMTGTFSLTAGVILLFCFLFFRSGCLHLIFNINLYIIFTIGTVIII